MLIDIVNNRAWLLANDKELDFKLWCKRKDIPSDNPWSLQFYRTELKKTAEKEKMIKSFSNLNGFFICWQSEVAGNCSVFNQDESKIDFLFEILKETMFVEKYQLKDGELTQLA